MLLLMFMVARKLCAKVRRNLLKDVPPRKTMLKPLSFNTLRLPKTHASFRLLIHINFVACFRRIPQHHLAAQMICYIFAIRMEEDDALAEIHLAMKVGHSNHFYSSHER